MYSTVVFKNGFCGKCFSALTFKWTLSYKRLEFLLIWIKFKTASMGPVCVLRWVISWFCCTNSLLQSPHLNGRSPKKVNSQFLNVRIFLKIDMEPVWILRWLWSCIFCTNALSQWSHLKGRSPKDEFANDWKKISSYPAHFTSLAIFFLKFQISFFTGLFFYYSPPLFANR